MANLLSEIAKLGRALLPVDPTNAPEGDHYLRAALYAQSSTPGDTTLKITSTGGLQVNPDGLTLGDDSPATLPISSYPAQQTFTAVATESSTTFSFDLSTAGPGMAAVQSLEGAFEVTSLGRNITGVTIQLRDTIGATTGQGPTYNIYNVAVTAINTLPTFLVSDNTTGFWRLPIVDSGGFKTALMTVTFSGASTNAGTVKAQLKANPFVLPLAPAYIVYGQLAAQGIDTNTTLFQSPGTNNRLWLLEALITNDATAALTLAKIVNNDASKSVIGGSGRVAAPGGFHVGPLVPYGYPASAQAQAVNFTNTSGGTPVCDVWAAFRIGV